MGSTAGKLRQLFLLGILYYYAFIFGKLTDEIQTSAAAAYIYTIKISSLYKLLRLFYYNIKSDKKQVLFCTFKEFSSFIIDRSHEHK